MDFHYKKYMRKYKIDRFEMDYRDAQLFLKYEKLLYSAVDFVLLVSEKEANDIRKIIFELQRQYKNSSEHS